MNKFKIWHLVTCVATATGGGFLVGGQVAESSVPSACKQPALDLDEATSRCDEFCAFRYKNLRPGSFTINKKECRCVYITTVGKNITRTSWWTIPTFKQVNK